MHIYFELVYSFRLVLYSQFLFAYYNISFDYNKIHFNCLKKCFNCSYNFKDCQQKCKKKPSVMITWMSVDFYTKVLNSCRTLLESVQKPDLETVIDKVVKIYDALMYIQGEYKKAVDQNNQ